MTDEGDHCVKNRHQVSHVALLKHITVFQRCSKEISPDCPSSVSDFRLRLALQKIKWENERDLVLTIYQSLSELKLKGSGTNSIGI